ncbi:hypothetical protein CHS0354_009041 [Potamilus streckersoni]|uniref:Uncharacterized protein n=1 Tax=Potamilus streckersoni TaxID=2493646 RepID=A0AAE0TIG2_9BIVA|nr:hypothetical protein CHS0354_009041 [Potamilus streckersoni]
MIPPDRAFEEGSANSNSTSKISIGVLGLVSVCVAVFVIFLCAKKDSSSKKKKSSIDSRQNLLENQVSPARHGIDNKMYGASANGIGECLHGRNERSVLHGSTPMRVEGMSQNFSPQPSQPPTSPQNCGLKQALYNSSASYKPIQTTPIESEKNLTVFGRSQPEVKPSSLPCDENLDSDGYIQQYSEDELYLVPKSNKPINEKKPLPSLKRPGACDSVMKVNYELANTSSNYGTSMYTNSIRKVDMEKGKDNQHEPWIGKSQEKLIQFSTLREVKLSESESGIDENKFQYEFKSRTKLEGEAESLYVAPKSNKLTDPQKPLWSVNSGSKNSRNVSKTTFEESSKGPHMPVYKYGGNNYDSSTAMSISPSPVKPPVSPLPGSETCEVTLEYQFTTELNSTDAEDAPYDVPKSSRPNNDRTPFALPTIVDSSETKPIDGANTTKEPEMESTEPQTRFNRPKYWHATSNKRDILEQKNRLQSPLSDKLNAKSSKSAGLSTTRTTPDESKVQTEFHLVSKMYADKEDDPNNSLHKSVPGKQVQNIKPNLERKRELVSSRGDTIDDDGYTDLNSFKTNASEIDSSDFSTKYDPTMYKNNISPARDLPPPPPACNISYVDVPYTLVSKQNKSVTNDVDSETEDRLDYINCTEFSKKNDNLKRLKETNFCPPAPCLAHRYINICHKSSKELEEDSEYVAMNTDDKLNSHAKDNSVAKYANIQDILVPLTSVTDSDMYLPMTKHLSHANSDTYLYQNAKLKENKNIYVNSSFSIESTQKSFHDSEQDDTYSYAAADFFSKIKMAVDAANKSDDSTHDDKARKQPVRSTSFQTATSAKEMHRRTQTSKPQKFHQTDFVSKTILAGKPSLETDSPPQNAEYK